jgi:transcriptional activator SPT8
VLTLANDEKSVLSGSWDGIVYDWDLNTGQATRGFLSSAGQISSVGFRPYSTDWQDIKSDTLVNGVSGGQRGSNGVNGGATGDEDAPGSPVESNRSFGSLFGDDDDMGMGFEEDEMSRAIQNGLGPDPNPPDNNGEPKDENDDVVMGDDSGDPQPDDAVEGSSNSGNGTQGNSTFHPASATSSSAASSDQNVFLASSMDGTFRIWDRRQATPVATSMPQKGVPPWCMNACWSTNGNFVYAGRRNGTVEEFSVHKGVGEPTRTMKFPLGSGPVSALTAMPNGRHLIWYLSPACSLLAIFC